MIWRSTVLTGVALACVAAGGATTREAAPPHLRDAETLVENIRPADNEYVHRGCYIHWKGEDGATAYGNHNDCSYLVALLFEHTYRFTPEQVKRLTGQERPLATTWHDAIATGRGGLVAIPRLADAKPGDILAVRYRPGETVDTGHVMLVDRPPVRRTASAPVVPGTTQWDVTVIDSTKDPHGPDDTRHGPGGGLSSGVGRGTIRVYTNPDGTVAGYAWSDGTASTFRAQSDRNMVIGRLNPPGG